ncbi:hypothetical protein VUR80DRAFT_8906 [Thermomyces stellatus]
MLRSVGRQRNQAPVSPDVLRVLPSGRVPRPRLTIGDLPLARATTLWIHSSSYSGPEEQKGPTQPDHQAPSKPHSRVPCLSRRPSFLDGHIPPILTSLAPFTHTPYRGTGALSHIRDAQPLSQATRGQLERGDRYQGEDVPREANNYTPRLPFIPIQTHINTQAIPQTALHTSTYTRPSPVHILQVPKE